MGQSMCSCMDCGQPKDVDLISLHTTEPLERESVAKAKEFDSIVFGGRDADTAESGTSGESGNVDKASPEGIVSTVSTSNASPPESEICIADFLAVCKVGECASFPHKMIDEATWSSRDENFGDTPLLLAVKSKELETQLA